MLAATGCGGDSGGTGKSEAEQRTERCAKLRDHVVGLQLAGVARDREQHRRALGRALGEEFVARCSNAPDSAIDCALAATDRASADACLVASAQNAQNKR